MQIGSRVWELRSPMPDSQKKKKKKSKQKQYCNKFIKELKKKKKPPMQYLYVLSRMSRN